jgi:type I restriction enzyme, S subunit
MSAVMEVREASDKYLSDLQPRLVQHFELLGTAPGGVAKLRELILTLAVQGKLVPQDPSDEPARELLKRIRAEKDRLFVEGTIKREKPLEAVVEDEKPFLLPDSWEWVRIPEVTHGLGQVEPTTSFSYIDVASIDNMAGRVAPEVQVLEAADAPSRARKNVTLGTVIYSTIRPYLKNIAVIERDYAPRAIASTAFAVLHPHTGVSSKYLLHYLRSRPFTDYVNTKAVGVAYPAINDANFFLGVVALPPAAEQSRIVTRVEELMGLCDALEAKGQLEAAQHAQLVQTLLGALTASTSPEELADNWQRVATHFDLLLDRPEAIDALEQTILQLGVRGLLVSQNFSQLQEANRKSTGGEKFHEGELPFEVPIGWRWVRLGSVAELINGDRGSNYPNKTEYVSNGMPFINTGHIEPDGTLSKVTMNFLTKAKFDSLRSGKTKPGDLVYCLRGATLGKTAIVDYSEGAIASSLVIVRPNTDFDRKYAYLYLTSPLGQRLVRRFDNGSAQPNLAAGSVRKYVVPLPPLEEQARIVARVESLRRLCADLRQRLTARQTTQTHLAEALIDGVA